MKSVLLSPAKVNLLLDVGEKKEGYHDIYTIMQTVSLYDTLTFTIKKNNNKNISIDSLIHITTNKYFIPTDSRNLCFKAIRYILENYNIRDHIYLNIKKAIPTGGGLGGGSSNFYQVIKFLNNYYKLNLNINDIQNICNKYGSDISFFTVGGTCLCTGRGEIVKKINNFPMCFILIINPYIRSSTKEAYDEYDNIAHLDFKNKKELFIEENCNNNNLYKLIDNMYNSFENQMENKYPLIKEIKDFMKDNGSIFSMMTGSGSSIYGIFDDFNKVKSCKEKLIKKYKVFSIIAKPI